LVCIDNGVHKAFCGQEPVWCVGPKELWKLHKILEMAMIWGMR
jgi:hypothetical protein